MREAIKSVAGVGVAATVPQCRFSNCIFVIAHMRCGSTALSNILCSRPDVSGYGETHIRYDGRAALGRLVVNQALRRSWRPRATFLFDKILHSRHDSQVVPAFFDARAIFIAREPGPAVRSIQALFDGLKRTEYANDTKAAEYFVERVTAVIALWNRFPPDRRVALTHASLMADPEAELTRISDRLNIAPALENRYMSPSASRKGGGGDPLTSGRFTRIEPRALVSEKEPPRLDVAPALARAADDAYGRFLETTGKDRRAVV